MKRIFSIITLLILTASTAYADKWCTVKDPLAPDKCSSNANELPQYTKDCKGVGWSANPPDALTAKCGIYRLRIDSTDIPPSRYAIIDNQLWDIRYQAPAPQPTWSEKQAAKWSEIDTAYNAEYDSGFVANVVGFDCKYGDTKIAKDAIGRGKDKSRQFTCIRASDGIPVRQEYTTQQLKDLEAAAGDVVEALAGKAHGKWAAIYSCAEGNDTCLNNIHWVDANDSN